MVIKALSTAEKMEGRFQDKLFSVYCAVSKCLQQWCQTYGPQARNSLPQGPTGPQDDPKKHKNHIIGLYLLLVIMLWSHWSSPPKTKPDCTRPANQNEFDTPVLQGMSSGHKKCGCKHVSTKQDNQKLAKLVRSDQFQNCGEIAQQQNADGVPAS